MPEDSLPEGVSPQGGARPHLPLGEVLLQAMVGSMVEGLETVPEAGALVLPADGWQGAIAGMRAEQAPRSAGEKVQQVTELGQLRPQEAREIAAAVIGSVVIGSAVVGSAAIGEGRVVSAPLREAVIDLASVIPSRARQRTQNTLAHAQRRGTAAHLAIPVDPRVHDEIEVNRFYGSLLPERRPRFSRGAPVPNRGDWVFDDLVGAGGFGEVWRVRRCASMSRRPRPRRRPAKTRTPGPSRKLRKWSRATRRTWPGRSLAPTGRKPSGRCCSCETAKPRRP